jgi:hypothetical protein
VGQHATVVTVRVTTGWWLRQTGCPPQIADPHEEMVTMTSGEPVALAGSTTVVTAVVHALVGAGVGFAVIL